MYFTPEKPTYKTKYTSVRVTTRAISGTAVDAGMFRHNHSGGSWSVCSKQSTNLAINQILLSRAHPYMTPLSKADSGSGSPAPAPLTLGSGGRSVPTHGAQPRSPKPGSSYPLPVLPAVLDSKLHEGRDSVLFPPFPAPTLRGTWPGSLSAGGGSTDHGWVHPVRGGNAGLARKQVQVELKERITYRMLLPAASKNQRVSSECQSDTFYPFVILSLAHMEALRLETHLTLSSVSRPH